MLLLLRAGCSQSPWHLPKSIVFLGPLTWSRSESTITMLYFILFYLFWFWPVHFPFASVFLKRFEWIFVLMRMCLLNQFCLLHEFLDLSYFPSSGLVVPTVPGSYLSCISSTAGCPSLKVTFSKMAECAHFHYENVEFGSIQVYLRYLLHTEARRICVYIHISDRWHLEVVFPVDALLVDVKISILFSLTNIWHVMTPISSSISRNSIIQSV